MAPLRSYFFLTGSTLGLLLAPLAGCPADDRNEGEDFGDGIETLGETDESESETDTDESGTDTDTDTDTDEEEPPTCSSTTAVAQAVPPNVMLVLDKSRSMILNSWDDDGLAQTCTAPSRPSPSSTPPA
ncbi:hypothetical protein ACNOYE_20245 [Nannocystaceae bacterium ST9]